MSRRGFTLTEVMLTVGVIMILASAAMPQYTRMMERSYFRETETLLLTIYSGEQVYFTGNDQFSSTWTDIFMDDPNGGSLPVTFTVTSAGSGAGATFTATATRNGGPCNGRTRTINQARTWGGTWAGCPTL